MLKKTIRKQLMFAVSAATLSVLATPMMPAAEAAPAQAAYQMWMAPWNSCSDANDGSTKDKPVCTAGRVSALLETKFKQGLLNNDVEVRLITTKGAYTPKNDNGKVIKPFASFTYAPAAGTTMRILPEWYTTDAAAQKKPVSSYPHITGLPNGKWKSTENGTGMVIQPAKNRGGTFQVSYLKMTKLTDGLLLNAINKTYDSFELNAKAKKPLENAQRGENASVKNAEFSHLVFENLGTKHAGGVIKGKDGKNQPMDYNGNGVIRFRNVDGLTVKDTSITNFETGKTGLGHVIYGAYSSNVLFDNLTVKNSGGSTVVHGRMQAGWKVWNSEFIDTPARGDISNWARGAHHINTVDGDKNLYGECDGELTLYQGLNNKKIIGNKAYNDSKILRANNTNNQRAACSAKSRMYSPVDVSLQRLDNGNYEYKWGDAYTQENNIVNYVVYVGKTLNQRAPHTNELVEKFSAVKTLSKSTRSVILTQSDLKKVGVGDNEEFEVFVVAKNSRGETSPRTQTRLWGYNKKNTTTNKGVGGSFDTPKAAALGKTVLKDSTGVPVKIVKPADVNSQGASLPASAGAVLGSVSSGFLGVVKTIWNGIASIFR